MKIRYLPFKESTCQVDRDEDHCLFQIVSSWGSSNRDGGDCSFIDCKERKSHVSLSTDCSNKLTFLGQGSHREIRSSGLVYRAKPWVVKSDHLPRFSAEPVSLIEVRSGGNRGFHFSDSAQAAITKYHWLDCLKNRHFFLTVLESGKSTIKVPCWPVWFLPKVLLLVHRCLPSCCILTWQRKQSCLLFLFL